MVWTLLGPALLAQRNEQTPQAPACSIGYTGHTRTYNARWFAGKGNMLACHFTALRLSLLGASTWKGPRYRFAGWHHVLSLSPWPLPVPGVE